MDHDAMKSQVVSLLNDRVEKLHNSMVALQPYINQNENVAVIYQNAHIYACNIGVISDIINETKSISQKMIDAVEDEVADVDKVLALVEQLNIEKKSSLN